MMTSSRLFKKDIRHLQTVLWVWFGLLLLNGLFAGAGTDLFTGDMRLQMIYQTLGVVLPLFQYIVILIIIPLLIHDEPLVGTTAFWFTRPISNRLLLKSKVIFLLTVLVIPLLLVEIAVLAANGIALEHIGLATLEVLVSRVTFVLTVAIIAVLTPNFARFAIVGIAVLVASWLLMWAVQVVRMLSGFEAFYSAMMNVSLQFSKQIVATLLTVAVAVKVVTHQYLTRKTRQCILYAVVGFILIQTTQMFWPWDFMKPKRMGLSANSFNAADVAFKINRERLTHSDFRKVQNYAERKVSISSPIEAEGLPEEYFFILTDRSARMKYGDGKTIVGSRTWDFHSGDERKQQALRAALTNWNVIAEDEPGWTHHSIFQINESDYHTYGRLKGTLRLTLESDIYQYQPAARLDLKPGERHLERSTQYTISDVLTRSFGCQVVLQKKSINLKYQKDRVQRLRNVEDMAFVLVNPKEGVAYFPENNDRDPFQGSMNFGQRLQIEDATLDFTLPFHGGEIDEWLKDCRLLLLKPVKVGDLRKTETYEDIVLDTGMTVSDGILEELKEKHGLDDEDIITPQMAQPSNTTRVVPSANIELDDITPQTAQPSNTTRVVPAAPIELDDIDTYIEACLEKQKSKRGGSSRDQAVDALVRVGSEHIDKLLKYDNFYCRQAVKRLATEDSKDVILAHLPMQRNLIEVVEKFGWGDEVRPLLLEGLRQHDSLPPKWIKTVSSWEDPETYEGLKHFLTYGNNPERTYRYIKNLPDFNMAEAVAEAWRVVQFQHRYKRAQFVLIAAQFGITDAVADGLHLSVAEQINEHMQKELKEKLYPLVEGIDEQTDVAAWLREYEDHIVFDPETGKYRAVNPEA